MTWIAWALLIALVYAALLILIWGFFHGSTRKPTPSPTSLQGRADSLRAMGDEADAIFTEPAELNPGGSWVAPREAFHRWPL